MTINRIGNFTSGGDCVELNAVIRVVTKRASPEYDWEVYGINDVSHGWLDRPPRYKELTLPDFTGIVLRMCGTIMGSANSSDLFDFPMPDCSRQDRSQEVIDGYTNSSVSTRLSLLEVMVVWLSEKAEAECRVMVLGHSQRGGVPIPRDTDCPGSRNLSW